MLWLKSRNSEVWLDRRTNYTRSAAVMSMVSIQYVRPLLSLRQARQFSSFILPVTSASSKRRPQPNLTDQPTN